VPRIQTPQHVQALMGDFKIRSPFGLFLREDIQPVVVIADLSGSSVADRGFPRAAMGQDSEAAGGVGTNTEVACVGVGGRGLIYHLTAVIVFHTTDGVFQFRTGAAETTLVDNPDDKTYMDLRIVTDRPNLSLAADAPLTANRIGTPVATVGGLAETSHLYPLDVVLGAGQFFSVSNSNANEAQTTVFYWTEYLLEDR